MRHRLTVVVVAVLVGLLTVPSPSLAAAWTLESPADAVFDPAVYGRVLADHELDEVDGAWVNVAIGAAIGAASHIYANGVDIYSGEWWVGLAVSSATSALIPSSGAAIAAGSLTGAARVAMYAYSHVATAVLSFGPHLAD